MRKWVYIFLFTFSLTPCFSNSILIPMDREQKNHLKAYGMAFFTLQSNLTVDWLLNYRGGSFLLDFSDEILNECSIRGVTYEILSDASANQILTEISSPSVNMNDIKLETAPKIAVYSPKNDYVLDETDAVLAVLDYAEIPYDLVYDEEVLSNQLLQYDWLHLHHEDFTGQVNRFLWRESAVVEAKMQETTAMKLGYPKVSAMKYDVAKKIREFCAGGGYIFAMCSAAETFDIALASNGTDLSESNFNEEDIDPEIQQQLDYSQSFAFENFTLEPGRRFSDINTGRLSFYGSVEDFFTLFEFSAKWDIIPSLLTQNHEHVIREFFGRTTAFEKRLVKPNALILGENGNENRVRYIYGEFGRGHWTYYSGHDPERNAGRGAGVSPQLDLFPHSPGYRLILNNVLFPSAKRKKQKT